MKKYLAVVAVTLFSGVVAFAQSNISTQGVELTDVLMTTSADSGAVPATAGAGPAAKGPCSKINLTAAQKALIKTAALSFQATKITLEAQVKTAALNYRKAALEPKTAYADALTASQNVAATVGQMIAAKSAFKTQVLFQILTADQRAPALACERLHKRFHKRRGHRRGGKPAGETSAQE